MGARERPGDRTRSAVVPASSRTDRRTRIAKRGRREHEGQRRAADAAGDRSSPRCSHSHLARTRGSAASSQSPDGELFEGATEPPGRAPRRGRRPARPPARPPAARRSTRRSSRARITAAPRPAPTRSSPPASPGSSSASRTPTRTCAGAGHRPAAGRRHRGRRRRVRRRGARPARALLKHRRTGRP